MAIQDVSKNLLAKQSESARARATAGTAIQSISGIAYQADRMSQIIKDLRNANDVKEGPQGTKQKLAMTAKFAADILTAGSLAQAPELPAPYLPPLLYCTEPSAIFGDNKTTNGIVVFPFSDIGNLYVEDNSQPRAIPIQQVPDSDEDNVQDMGRTSGVIRIAGRVFGQAGLSRFNMLRDLCHYKGKLGLMFDDINIGRYRVYPANIPGYTTSAEFFNQYAFQINLIIVSDANKKSLFHKFVDQAVKHALAVSNVGALVRARLYESLNGFKKVMDTFTASQRTEELKKIFDENNIETNDEKLDEVMLILQYGNSRQAVITLEEKEFPEFETPSEKNLVELRNVVPSRVMSNGYTDGDRVEYWLPAREPGELFEVYYRQYYNRLPEQEMPDEDKDDIFADKGLRKSVTPWTEMTLGSDYSVIDSTLRDGYPGLWSKITFTNPPAKWGIVKVNYRLPADREYELFDGNRVEFGQGLLYVDVIEGAIRESQIVANFVPYPISGSLMNVIEEANVTELYLPELFDDPATLETLKVWKRTGPATDSTMEEITDFTVTASSLWPSGKPGRWGQITLSEPLQVGDFVSIDAVLKTDAYYVSRVHPDYTIKNGGAEIVFKWLSSPVVKGRGYTIKNMVISPDIPDTGDFYNENFLTDGGTIYWVKGGIDENYPVVIKLSNGNSIFGTIDAGSYTIDYDVLRPAYSGRWAKITFDSAPRIHRILMIECRLIDVINFYQVDFINAEFYDDGNIASLLWMDSVEDEYQKSTYKDIYPLPVGGNTGTDGIITEVGQTEFWLPKIYYLADEYISEIYPLRVYKNGAIVGNYTVEQQADRQMGASIEIWTKITFDAPMEVGSVVSVDFTAEEEQTIYDGHYLEQVEPGKFTDECEPMKNSYDTTQYYTPYAIDINKPIEVRIDGVLIPPSHYTAYKVSKRVHENEDAVNMSQLHGRIDFAYKPGDTTTIIVKYNRFETPREEEMQLARYTVTTHEVFSVIKDHYVRNSLKPIAEKVPDRNNRDYNFIKFTYFWPYPNGNKYYSYKDITNPDGATPEEMIDAFASEYFYVPYDGLGVEYKGIVQRYSFEKLKFDPRGGAATTPGEALLAEAGISLHNDVSGFNQLNTPFSMDITLPKDGEKEWIARYNALVARYPDATFLQEREIASMLLGKYVDVLELSEEDQITADDVANAKLWIQVFQGYLSAENYVEAQKMIDERTQLLEIGVEGVPIEQDAKNTISVPNEQPDPVDIPPTAGWTVSERVSSYEYKKDYIEVELTRFSGAVIASFISTYRNALVGGLKVGIEKNQPTGLYYDSSKPLRARFTVNDEKEEYQFENVGELVQAVLNGQTVNTSEGAVTLIKSAFIANAEVVGGNATATPKEFRDTVFRQETFVLDKASYEVFLLAVYGDYDAIEIAKNKNYAKYQKYQEIIGYNESGLTLEEGLQFLPFSQIVSVTDFLEAQKGE